MSHSDKARVAMTDAVSEAYAPVVNAGRVLANALRAMQGHEDLEEAMRSVLAIIVAGEQLGENVKAFAEASRTALATCIDDTGCPEVVTLHHKATMARKPAFVSISGKPQLDARFYNEPTYNKVELKKALEDGEEVHPDVQLMRPNSMTLRILTRK